MTYIPREDTDPNMFEQAELEQVPDGLLERLEILFPTTGAKCLVCHNEISKVATTCNLTYPGKPLGQICCDCLKLKGPYLLGAAVKYFVGV